MNFMDCIDIWYSIKVLRSLGNLVAGDLRTTNAILVPGHEITGKRVPLRENVAT